MDQIKSKTKDMDFKKYRSLTLLITLFLVLCIAAAGTLAFLLSKSDEIKNVLNPGKVTTEVDEKRDDNKKTNVSIKNTGNVDAYIRAKIVITWKDNEGNVYGKVPVAGEDYNIEYNLDEGWTLSADGFYYWTTGPVAPNDLTGILIKECSPVQDKAPTGYYLNVEILGDGIQAKGADEEGNPPVVIAWSTDVNNLAVTAGGGLTVTEGGGA